jgi:sucrose-6-phosphate hydrolase SacC (GH32 family)
MFELPVDGDSNNKKWVFFAHRYYYVGTFDGEVFTPEGPRQTADFGHSFAAAQTFSQGPNGRVVQMAWAAGGRYPRMPFNQQDTFPAELSLRTTPEGIKLFREPVKEITKLHAKEHSFTNVSLESGNNPLENIKAGLLEIDAEIQLGDTKTVDFTIKGQKISYDVAVKRISSMGKDAALAPMKGNRIKLHILVDTNMIELFANNGEVSMTSCIIRGWWDHNKVMETPYPRRQFFKDDVAVFATGGTANIISMKIWELKSMW